MSFSTEIEVPPPPFYPHGELFLRGFPERRLNLRRLGPLPIQLQELDLPPDLGFA